MEKQDNTAVARLKELQAWDQRHHMHPFTDPGALRSAPPFVIESAEGCFVSGQNIRLLDMMAGLGCVNIGYGRQEMADVAAKTMKELSYYHSFAAVTNPAVATLSEKIASLAPGSLNKVFFANSGSEAIETIGKLVRLYWRRKGKPNKQMFLSRDLSYHGSTMFAASLNGLQSMHKPFGLNQPQMVHHAATPFWYRFGGDSDAETFGKLAAQSLEEKILEVGADKIAAFFGEPIQGTLGAIIPPDSYWPLVEEICKKHNILLVADEVLTGCGRTGNWFAQETFGFQADIMAISKGLSSGYQPISAAVFSDEVAEIIEKENQVIQHGFTTSAHPVCTAIALKNIEILERENLIGRIKNDIGPKFKAALKSLEDHELVGEVRSCGLIAAIEITQNKETRAQFPLDMGIDHHIANHIMIKGVIVRPAGNVLVLCPPYIITEAEIDFAVDAIRFGLDTVLELIKKG